MFHGLQFSGFIPIMILIRILPSFFFMILVALTIIFWVIYGVNKFKWAKITAIVLSSVLGVFFIGSITMTILRGFMPMGRGMVDGLKGLGNGIRRF